MLKKTAGLLVVLAAVGGCASSPSEPAPPSISGTPNPAIDPTVAPSGTQPSFLNDNGDRVIAQVDYGIGPKLTIKMGELMKPLIESHGLDTLMLLVQLDMARQRAEDLRPPVRLTPEEISAERNATFGKVFAQSDADNDELIEKAVKANKPQEVERLKIKKEVDREDLLKRLLEQQRISRSEFEIILETNALLRKMVEPQVQGKITEAMLQARFKFRFNERVRVRHIEVYRPQDAVEVKRRLAAGEPFVQVVREMSKNLKSAVLDGELPPFSREDNRLPQNFKDAAFALKPGEVSDAIQTGESWQIIKLEEKIMPAGVKFEDVRDQLRRELVEETLQVAMGEIRREIGVAAKQYLKINDPVLEQQFKAKMEAADKANAERIIEQEREATRQGKHSATNPAVTPTFDSTPTPSTAPATNPVPSPATRPVAPAAAPAPMKTVTASPTTPAAAHAPAAAATGPAGATTRPAGSPK